MSQEQYNKNERSNLPGLIIARPAMIIRPVKDPGSVFTGSMLSYLLY